MVTRTPTISEKKPVDARTVALRALLDGSPSAASLALELSRSPLAVRDRAFATQLFHGTLKMQRALTWSLGEHLRQPLERLDEPLRWILLLGAYQLLCLQRIPAHSAVNECVRLARETGHSGTAALANAVLRKIATAGRLPPRPDERPTLAGTEGPADASDVAALADFASLPDWIAQHLIDRFGWKLALQIGAEVNLPPRRALRFDSTAEEDVRELDNAGYALRRSSCGIPECRIVETPSAGGRQVEGLIGSGRAVWQSEESQLAVHLLNPQPGETILDVCAGRGTKTLMLARRMAGAGAVYCVDDDAHKIQALRAAIFRSGMRNVHALQADGRRPYPQAVPARVDAALVDAPCSALGLIARRVDVRWRKLPSDPYRLAQVQNAIIAQAAEHVRPGGRLLYVTCSTHEAEDEKLVHGFLAHHPDWNAAPLEIDGIPIKRFGDFCLSVPGIDGGDGFFYALLVRDP